MRIKLVSLITGTLLLLFGVGVVFGYATSSRINTTRPVAIRSQEWARHWIANRMQRDFERLQPTQEQQAALEESYAQLLSDFNAIQEEASVKVAAAFKRHGADVWKQLTPEQRVALRQLNQERRVRPAHKP